MYLGRLFAVAIIALSLAGCEREVYRNLTQRDANEMVAVLSQQGISATRDGGEGGQYRLMVDERDFSRAVELLSTAGYPRDTYRSIEDVFPGDKMIQSPFEQRARLSFALSQELARSVSLLDGVVFARVHVVVPETDLRGQPQGKPSAALVIRHRAGADTAALAAQAKAIVSAGLPSLDYKDVSVVMASAAIGGQDARQAAPAATASPSSLWRWALPVAIILALAGAFVLLRGRSAAR